MEPPREERLSLSPDVVVTVLEQDAVLLDLHTKYFYSVNAIGWAIVQLFESATTRAEVQAQCRAWGAPAADAAAIDRFLDVLLGDRLARAAENGHTAATVAPPSGWALPVIEKHREPLQRVMISAFDPSLPLAE